MKAWIFQVVARLLLGGVALEDLDELCVSLFRLLAQAFSEGAVEVIERDSRVYL